MASRQIEEITSGLSFCSIEDHERTTILSQLELLDIHFNWSLHQDRPDGSNPEIIVSKFNRKLKDMLDDSGFTFKSFCCQLTMAQELIKYDTAGALMKVLECEPWVMSLKSGTCREHQFVSIRQAVEYIYLGCKAFALFKCGSIAEAKKVLLHIPDLKYMEEKQKSGIYGVKACAFMEYGLEGFLKALEYISTARTKYPTMAEWHFLTGKLMSRIRHVKYPMTMISDEEESFHRTAFKLDKNEASYALYVAQITREKAYSLFNECRYDREAYKNSLESINKMNEEALSLYTMLIETNQNDAYILGRCAFGMVKLPGPYKRLDLAVDAIDQALKISPDNPLVNHYAGLIYHRFLKDDVKGWKYLEQAANKNNYPALLDWLRLKYLVDPENYDPLPELTKALEYNDVASVTLTEIASWYFFKKLDIFSAWDNLMKVNDDHFIRNHKSHFLNMASKCNLFEIIFDEVKLKLAECIYKDKQEKEKLLSISRQLQTLCPQSHPTEYSNLRSIIVEQSDIFTSVVDRNTRGGSKGTTTKWRSSTGNVKSSVQSGSSICMGGKVTDSWRNTNPKHHGRSTRNRLESSNSSRDIINSNSNLKQNCFASKIREPQSTEGVSTRNASPSTDRKISSNRIFKKHERPLYFPKGGSQANNFANNF